MTAIGRPGISQQPTHQQIIEPAGAPALVSQSWCALDAIIVPASRPARNLRTAIRLATELTCELVILCSWQTDPKELTLLLASHRYWDAMVVQVPIDYSHERFDFETTRWMRSQVGKRVSPRRGNDLSVKRNIGLLLARMAGWQRIFFLDDDIQGISADAVRTTASLLGTATPGGLRYRCAGMTVQEFPDNSVVCHARRAVGEYQDVFVTGSALAVDCSAPVTFFPHLYNEDWLFFYDDAADKRLTSSSFHAQQLYYDPFANPQRANVQEFGDVIAEGLYALLHSGHGTAAADHEYWCRFLTDRNHILTEIIERSRLAPRTVRQDMIRAVSAAHETLREIRPDMCVQYITMWRDDLEWWQRQQDMLPNTGTVEKALRELELSPITPSRFLVASTRMENRWQPPSQEPSGVIAVVGMICLSKTLRGRCGISSITSAAKRHSIATP